jgi:hypothetical protein
MEIYVAETLSSMRMTMPTLLTSSMDTVIVMNGHVLQMVVTTTNEMYTVLESLFGKSPMTERGPFIR